ncbi:ABC transporter ATP-binding protein [Dinghuibacter silviterrae]|uniref:ABC-2 type transport system ATP-binding protein n=1 Tax=Dinghuibacter silviterrae TaxID=1539049 RepID=A0A4R8DGZ4_9BACT|nr:ABC transporter ATP-binding protein [Dinghuibacter silviterrae]TDW96795.1 ABC-2 type transport system ATP-binding protein [Dinghuibacter silviterrae]
MTILSVNGLSKRYGAITALRDVSFEVPQGAVFGILGPNGSGKTTLLGILMDVLKPNAGTFQWFGHVPTADDRRRIGCLLETPNFYHYLSARRNLEITASIKGHGFGEIDAVLDRVGLLSRKDTDFSTFSLGMKQRLAIGASLLGSPEVMVLDEPTNGLDPVGIAEIRELIKSLSREGKTILMASHLLDEVEKVCTHMALLKKGELLTTGRVSDILAQGDIVECKAPAGARDVLAAFPGVQAVQTQDGLLELVFAETGVSLGRINEYCFSHGIILEHLALKRKSLEARFLELTQN